jgi:hypothetical protein
MQKTQRCLLKSYFQWRGRKICPLTRDEVKSDFLKGITHFLFLLFWLWGRGVSPLQSHTSETDVVTQVLKQTVPGEKGG